MPVWAGLFGQELDASTRTVMYWLSAIVATPCALYAGRIFFESAWRSLRRGKANMDVPISIGVILTLIVSFSETIQGGRHAYFDAAVTLLFLLLIGRWMDHQLRARAMSAARDLLALQAPVARRLDAAGLEHGVPIGQITVGDLIAIAPGERAPVDGQVAEGASSLDNALITGETTPWAVQPGSMLRAGALNLDGRLVIRVLAKAEDSALAAIARLMEAGAQSKSAYVRLADRAAAIYVPVVHSLALATFVGVWAIGLGPHEALLRAAAVLIITCPCALGLAVPAVQIAASGRLFRKGVLVKSGAALERLAEVDWVVFDKTGVLTEGRAAAARRARRSARPGGPAGARFAPSPVPGPDPRRWSGSRCGVGQGSQRPRRRGPDRRSPGPPRPRRLPRHRRRRAHRKRTLVRIRRRAEDAVPLRRHPAPRCGADHYGLKARGVGIEILSRRCRRGGRPRGRRRRHRKLAVGPDPIEKSEAIDRLKAAGHKVLMVGDGLNDAAALSRAHASMAPGAAVDASQNAADLVFEGEGLMAVVDAIDVARAARTRALENFGFSALYNLVAAPAAISA